MSLPSKLKLPDKNSFNDKPQIEKGITILVLTIYVAICVDALSTTGWINYFGYSIIAITTVWSYHMLSNFPTRKTKQSVFFIAILALLILGNLDKANLAITTIILPIFMIILTLKELEEGIKRGLDNKTVLDSIKYIQMLMIAIFFLSIYLIAYVMGIVKPTT